MSHIREQFEHLDYNKDERITKADLNQAMDEMGYAHPNDEVAESIIGEVDFDRKGGVEFKDFLDVSCCAV